ncbi:MAG: hypothetical protein AB3X41_03215 [Leptothrix ochracea]|uniref:hypothetical protein n=1 Tax=Leptothrix ochracea TaxID=735331 RepID=UPI0034E2C75B
MDCPSKSTPQISHVEFRDDSRYELTCSSGHRTITILQSQKFEVLFEIGSYAIIDGYYREAVSSFTSSLERFYEFAIRVFLYKSSESDNLFQQCWKSVSSQSERQLGAFSLMWATQFNKLPKLPSNNNYKFRNDVIHKGRIPTKEEAINYGEDILHILQEGINALRKQFPIEVKEIVFFHVRDSAHNSDKSGTIATLCIPTLVTIKENKTDTNLMEYINKLEQQKKAEAYANQYIHNRI